MNVDIRTHIKENFKNSSKEEIKDSIVAGIAANEEITLPGLGVFFEILWMNSDEQGHEYILDTLKKEL